MNDRAAGFITEPIVQTDGAVDFDCGKAELNSFFARHAYSNDERGIGKTFVPRRKEGEEGLPLVIGFYTLSMGDMDASVLPRKLHGNLPKYPLPVALIGRFAVDERAQGRGFGDALMSDASNLSYGGRERWLLRYRRGRQGREGGRLLPPNRIRRSRLGRIPAKDASPDGYPACILETGERGRLSRSPQ